MITNTKILLVLDLDETLVRATTTKLDVKEDFQYADFYVYKRPDLDRFLIEMSSHFKLAIWSSATDLYVEDISRAIKPKQVDFELIWGRSKCSLTRDYELDRYVNEKRLKKLKKKGYSLSQTLIVDDSPEKTRNNFGNAIYINAFKGAPEDVELAVLAKYLLTLKDVPNIRKIEKRGWRNI